MSPPDRARERESRNPALRLFHAANVSRLDKGDGKRCREFRLSSATEMYILSSTSPSSYPISDPPTSTTDYVAADVVDLGSSGLIRTSDKPVAGSQGTEGDMAAVTTCRDTDSEYCTTCR